MKKLAIALSKVDFKIQWCLYAGYQKLFSKYKADQIAIGVNGGKDSSVVLYLTMYYSQLLKIKPDFKYFYIKDLVPFDEVLDCIKKIEKEFGFRVQNLQDDQQNNQEKYQRLLREFFDEFELKCVIMGTRRTDPFSSQLNMFTEMYKEHGWPEGERFFPILDWKYKDIWSFIDEADILVSELYQRGFSYVGCKTKTVQNFLIRDGKTHAREANDNTEQLSRKEFKEKAVTKENRIKLNNENLFVFEEKENIIQNNELSEFLKVKQNEGIIYDRVDFSKFINKVLIDNLKQNFDYPYYLKIHQKNSDLLSIGVKKDKYNKIKIII